MEMTLPEKRMKHAAWARKMAEDYQELASKAQGEQRDRWLNAAQRMHEEASWSEASAGWMIQ